MKSSKNKDLGQGFFFFKLSELCNPIFGRRSSTVSVLAQMGRKRSIQCEMGKIFHSNEPCMLQNYEKQTMFMLSHQQRICQVGSLTGSLLCERERDWYRDRFLDFIEWFLVSRISISLCTIWCLLFLNHFRTHWLSGLKQIIMTLP